VQMLILSYTNSAILLYASEKLYKWQTIL